MSCPELGIPIHGGRLGPIRQGRETRIDLPCVDHDTAGAQRPLLRAVGRGGRDARAIELVHWPLKKWDRPAGLRRGDSRPCSRPVQNHGRRGGHSTTGELVLIGQWPLVWRRLQVFPKPICGTGSSRLRLPRVTWLTLGPLRSGPAAKRKSASFRRRAVPGGSADAPSPSPTPLEPTASSSATCLRRSRWNAHACV